MCLYRISDAGLITIQAHFFGVPSVCLYRIFTVLYFLPFATWTCETAAILHSLPCVSAKHAASLSYLIADRQSHSVSPLVDILIVLVVVSVAVVNITENMLPIAADLLLEEARIVATCLTLIEWQLLSLPPHWSRRGVRIPPWRSIPTG